MFEFLHESFQLFDVINADFENFHLQFLMQLSKYLGIKPDSGVDLLKEIGYSKAYDKQFSKFVDFFIQSGFEQHLKLGKSIRNEILMVFINFYRFHYDSIKEFKSVPVLKEVLS